MISDINEFCKLFKAHVPVAYEQEYYFAQLQKSPQYDWLSDTILEFEIWEQELRKSDLEVGKEKRKHLNQVVDRLSATQAYSAINSVYSLQDLKNQFDLRRERKDQHLVSIDIKSANYTLFLHFDSENKFPLSWDDYIFDLPFPLQQSKSFRQIVFGNLNPKRTQKLIYSELTLKLKEKIDAYFKQPEKCCTLLTDEIVYSFHSKKEALQFCLDFPHQIAIELGLWVRLIYSQPQGISGKDFYWSNMIENPFTEREKKYKKLIGVPGNQFYLYFKKFILEEKIDERDLFFMQDNQLAKWIV